MKVKSFAVLQRAVEEGFKLGWNRAHKYTDEPDETRIEDEVVSAIMGQICDVFSFSDDDPTE